MSVRPLSGAVFFEVEEINVHEWHPTPDGSGPPEQVHMEIVAKGFPSPLLMRFKGPGSIGRLILALRKHRDAVWPSEGPS